MIIYYNISLLSNSLEDCSIGLTRNVKTSAQHKRHTTSSVRRAAIFHQQTLLQVPSVRIHSNCCGRKASHFGKPTVQLLNCIGRAIPLHSEQLYGKITLVWYQFRAKAGRDASCSIQLHMHIFVGGRARKDFDFQVSSKCFSSF